MKGASFDFVGRDSLRFSLEADYRELYDVAGVHAWKAVHVLGGSIIEAVLVDHLSSLTTIATTKRPENMSFDELIRAGKDEGILSERSLNLSIVLKDYRNLIHAGRQIRLQQTIDEDGATVVLALVDMVIKEITAKKSSTYGPTADQIVTRIEQEPAAISISDHFFKQMQPFEQERLLKSVLITRYCDLLATGSSGGVSMTLVSLRQLYRTTFDFVPVNIREQIMASYVANLKREGGNSTLVHEVALLKGSDLQYLGTDDRQVVAKHLLSRLATDESVTIEVLARAIDGVGDYISSDEVSAFADAVCQTVLRDPYRGTSEATARRTPTLIGLGLALAREYDALSETLQDEFNRRIEYWRDIADAEERPSDCTMLETVKFWIERDIPNTNS